MENPTHYELLCVTPDATDDDIRAAYRRLIRIYHPDVAGAAGEGMTLRLNTAQRELLDPSLRAQYDRRMMYATVGGGAGQQHTAEETHWRPATAPPRGTPDGRSHGRRVPSVSPLRFRIWSGVAVASIGAILAVTAIVFAYCYSGPLNLTTPRVIPPLVIAVVWIVGGLSRPSKLFVALLVVGAALWPLSAFGVAPFSLLGETVPAVVLALLTFAAAAAVALRISAPRAVALSRLRTSAA